MRIQPDPHVYALLRELAPDYFLSKHEQTCFPMCHIENSMERLVGFRHPESQPVSSRFAFLLGTDLVNETRLNASIAFSRVQAWAT